MTVGGFGITFVSLWQKKCQAMKSILEMLCVISMSNKNQNTNINYSPCILMRNSLHNNLLLRIIIELHYVRRKHNVNICK